MTYYAIRLAAALAALVIVLFLIQKKFSKKKMLATGITVIGILLAEVGLMFLPFENLFYTFSSRQAALAYMHAGPEEAVVDGSSSTLVIYYDNFYSTDNFAILEKAGDGWKLYLDVWNPVFLKFNEERAIRVYKYQKDYYVIVSNTDLADMKISDSVGSDFKRMDNVSSGEMFVAHVWNPGSGYVVRIDDRVFQVMGGK